MAVVRGAFERYADSASARKVSTVIEDDALRHARRAAASRMHGVGFAGPIAATTGPVARSRANVASTHVADHRARVVRTEAIVAPAAKASAAMASADGTEKKRSMK